MQGLLFKAVELLCHQVVKGVHAGKKTKQKAIMQSLFCKKRPAESLMNSRNFLNANYSVNACPETVLCNLRFYKRGKRLLQITRKLH